MNINEKIQEIRQKPENERVKYVWGMVTISMFFVIVLWVVSLKDTFSGNHSSSSEAITPQEINLEEVIGSEK